MTYEKILTSIRSADLAPVCLLYGDENFLIDEIVAEIKKAYIEPSVKDLNLEILWGNDVKPETIIEKAITFPFLTGKRVVIVRGIDSLETVEEKKLLPYIASPSETTCLVLIANKLDSKKKFYSTLKKDWPTVNLKKFNKRQALKWAGQRAKSKGVTISSAAIEELVERAGTNLRRIDSELEKLYLYFLNGTVEPGDVRKFVDGTWNESIFSLVDAVGKKNIEQALRLLNGILLGGESQHVVFAMILRQIRLIWLVKTFKGQKVSFSEIPGRVGFAPFLLKGYISQADCFEHEDLKGIFSHMKKADQELKSDRPPKIVLEKLVIDLCGKGANLAAKT